MLQQINNRKLDYNLIQELVLQIAILRQNGYDVLLVTSGSVSAGRERCSAFTQTEQTKENAKKRGRQSIALQQMLAAVGQVRLMQIYADFFLEHDIIISQVLLTRRDFANRTSYLNIRNTLEQLLTTKILPIINENDVVSAEELAPNFGDNDHLALYTAALIGADYLFFLTSVPGVWQGKGKERQVLPRVYEVNQNLLQHCCPGVSSGGRGGMESKVLAAKKAMSFGIHSYILSGKEIYNVSRVLQGESVGTYFVPNGTKVKGYRKWLAAGALSQGAIIVDLGAETALREWKKSLLFSGILQVEGNFPEKVPVDLINETKKALRCWFNFRFGFCVTPRDATIAIS